MVDFYASINVGACGAISSSFIARDHGYWATFLVPTGIFCLVPLVLLYGRKRYVITPPRGSIIMEVGNTNTNRGLCMLISITQLQCFRVLRIAGHERISWNPIRTIIEFRKPGFWNPARPSYYPTGMKPGNITWDDAFVGEVSRTFKACKVFLFFPIFWWCYNQVDGNMSTVSASLMLGGTPNDLIGFVPLIFFTSGLLTL